MSNVPIGKPWQMAAADILEVPVSANNNRYLLVIQDYFTKWVEVVRMPDQTATYIVSAVTKIFCSLGIPEVLHLDQGRNFESLLFRGTLKAFGAKKLHTMAYHPQRRMGKSFATNPVYVLHSNPLVHWLLMYGRPPQQASFKQIHFFDIDSHHYQLQAKLAEMCDFIEANLVESASRQRDHYNRHSQTRKFTVGDHVCMSIPTAKK